VGPTRRPHSARSSGATPRPPLAPFGRRARLRRATASARAAALLNPVAAEALTMLDDTEGARPFAAAAAGVAGIFESSAWRAMAESAAASVARADGDQAQARAGFESAARQFERAGQPYWRERSRAHAATA
jgi:cobalamin biosynthesis protein CobT